MVRSLIKVKKGFLVLDISGTRLHVRKAPGLSSMGVGRRARAGLARALPEAAVRKRTVVGCPKRQLVKQLLYEQSCVQEVRNANKTEPTIGEASHSKTSSRPVTATEQRASQPGAPDRD